MATLRDIKPAPNSTKKKKRAARGPAGKGPKTHGKGMNGQSARKSPDIPAGFEGGQTPLYRRLPKKQYIAAFNKVEYTILNVSDLDAICAKLDKKILTPQLLLEHKVIKKLENGGLKILGNGEVTSAVQVEAHVFSASAKEKIEKAQGTAIIIQ